MSGFAIRHPFFILMLLPVTLFVPCDVCNTMHCGQEKAARDGADVRSIDSFLDRALSGQNETVRF